MQKFLQVLNKHIGTAEIPCARKRRTVSEFHKAREERL